LPLNGKSAASVGDPGAGRMTKSGHTDGDYFYVNGTPVMATMYGLDVQAQKRWGKAPDLLLSGPNEGQNVGSIVNGSGTVSNAQFAAARGIPAIALSADSSTADNVGLANPASVAVANLSLTLLAALQSQAGTGALLPAGLTLNVNFPKDLSKPLWAFSRSGSYNVYAMKFVENLSTDPVGKAYGITYPYPGVSIGSNSATPTGAQSEDESVVYKTRIAVTAMQVGFEHRPQGQAWLRVRLGNLLK
jgi:5'-nucleotidase